MRGWLERGCQQAIGVLNRQCTAPGVGYVAQMMDWTAVLALGLSLAAISGLLWQILRVEQQLPSKAWLVAVVEFARSQPPPPGVVAHLFVWSIVGPFSAYDVRPFVQGGAWGGDVEPHQRPVQRAESDPIRIVVECAPGQEIGTWVGLTWIRAHGKAPVRDGIRVNVETLKFQHWFWRRSLLPMRWRRNPKGRWGVRRQVVQAHHLVPDTDQPFVREHLSYLEGLTRASPTPRR